MYLILQIQVFKLKPTRGYYVCSYTYCIIPMHIGQLTPSHSKTSNLGLEIRVVTNATRFSILVIEVYVPFLVRYGCVEPCHRAQAGILLERLTPLRKTACEHF